ncbi:MAG TPA: molybdopterin cofactor-binding domain-containing protein [Opitutaceae bacterium]|nr:molybdopterin cofactor-binding domain-containing protein [Opitutaceae bacterium]
MTTATKTVEINRRHFLRATALLAGGFMVRWEIAAPASAAGATVITDISDAKPAVLNPWIQITPDNWTTIVVSQAEMGQGIETTLSAIVADELGSDWKRVRRENSLVGPAYQNPQYHWQFTGNAESIRTFHDYVRTLAAAAREMLIAAAAARWKIEPEQLRVADSFIFDDRNGRKASFGELAVAASKIAAPAKPKLKPRKDWKLVGGVELERVDIPAKIDGSAVFGIDVVVPNMAHAAVPFPRAFGATIERVNTDAAKAMPGVVDIVVLRQALTANGEKSDAVIAVAEKYWQAARALSAVDVSWSPPPTGLFDSKTIEAAYETAFAGKPFEPVVHEGDADKRLASDAENVVSAEYHSGWQAHAPLEPMNCTAFVDGDRCTLWAPTQGQEMCQIVLSYGLGIPKQNVIVNRTYLGGGFGRRLIADYAALAAYASRAVHRPVKLIWSREMDMARDHYRPAFTQRVRAALGADGAPAAMEIKLVAPTILRPVSPGPFPNPKIDPLCVEALDEIAYPIENLKVGFHLLDVPVPTMVWRTTGAGPNFFFLESFIDELAHRADEDPYRYRRRLLAKKSGNERLLAVLDLAAEKSGMARPANDELARGIACGFGFGSYFAQVVEARVTDDLTVDIRRVVSVIDCGTVLDPRIASASIASGVVWGLSQAYAAEISFADGGVAETNFNGYRILTLPDAPPTETHFIDSGQKLGGIGELGPLGVPPALTNAIFAATGKRLRALPLARSGVKFRGSNNLA